MQNKTLLPRDLLEHYAPDSTDLATIHARAMATEKRAQDRARARAQGDKNEQV